MSTRCRIGMIVERNKVVSIYCHNDGYIAGVGLMLHNHYQNPLKTKELLLLGDMSALDKEIGVAHNFYETMRGFCTFYGRDRFEKNVDAVLHSSPAEFAKFQLDDIEFSYLWSNGKWHVSKAGSEFRNLNTVIYEDIRDNSKAYNGKDTIRVLNPIRVYGERVPESKAVEAVRKASLDLTTTPFSAFKDAGEKIARAIKEKEKEIVTKCVDFSDPKLYNDEKAAMKPTKETVKPKESTMNTAQISRMKLEGFLRSQAGRFIGVKSVLKDGADATFNGRVVNDENKVTGNLAKPYICMYDNNRKGFRNVNLETISEVSTNGIRYSII